MPQDKALYQGFGMEVLTTAEMELADRLTIAAGTPGFALMLSAGQAAAEAAMDLVQEGSILVVAGRGNRGTRMEISGSALQSASDRQAGADHRCAVRRRSQPARERRTA